MDKALNVAEIARLYGVHRNTVAHWLDAGLPSANPVGGRRSAGRLVDLRTLIRWVHDHYERQHQEKIERHRKQLEGGALERKRNAEATLKEMEVRELESKLVRTDDVEAGLLAEADATREAMLGVARDAVQTGLIRPDQEAALQDLVRGALLSLSMMAVVLSPNPHSTAERE